MPLQFATALQFADRFGKLTSAYVKQETVRSTALPESTRRARKAQMHKSEAAAPLACQVAGAR